MPLYRTVFNGCQLVTRKMQKKRGGGVKMVVQQEAQATAPVGKEEPKTLKQAQPVKADKKEVAARRAKIAQELFKIL